jgi:hypothetical protein
LIWFQYLNESEYFFTWNDFSEALLLRFGLAYDESMILWRQLLGSDRLLLSLFTKLNLRYFPTDWKIYLKSTNWVVLLSGLKDDIRLPLRLLSPQNLNKAFAIAKIQEECVLNSRRTSKFNSYTNLNWQNNRSNMTSDAKVEVGYKRDNSSSVVPRSNIPIQKLSSAQMEDRRKKRVVLHL